MADRIERQARLRWVPIEKMRVSDMAQRKLRQNKVDQIAANFDPERLQTPTVNLRDGWYYVIDGQHRKEAMIQMGWRDQSIQCWTYEGMTEQEEADLFLHLNDVLPVNAFETHKVGVTAGRAVDTDVDRVVRAQGLHISNDRTPGAVRAVGTLKKVYGRDGAVTLGRTLRIARDAYGDSGLEAPVIAGLALLCARYNGELDEADAVARLGAAHGGANGLLGKAEQIRRQTGQTKVQSVAAAAVDIINAGKGGKKLPSWWKS